MLIYEEKQPRQHWRLGRVLEVIESKDNNIRGAKVLIGKSKQVITRPINKLYPIEETNERNENTKESIILNEQRPKREAAVIADIKRKFLN